MDQTAAAISRRSHLPLRTSLRTYIIKSSPLIFASLILTCTKAIAAARRRGTSGNSNFRWIWYNHYAVDAHGTKEDPNPHSTPTT